MRLATRVPGATEEGLQSSRIFRLLRLGSFICLSAGWTGQRRNSSKYLLWDSRRRGDPPPPIPPSQQTRNQEAAQIPVFGEIPLPRGQNRLYSAWHVPPVFFFTQPRGALEPERMRASPIKHQDTTSAAYACILEGYVNTFCCYSRHMLRENEKSRP